MIPRNFWTEQLQFWAQCAALAAFVWSTVRAVVGTLNDRDRKKDLE